MSATPSDTKSELTFAPLLFIISMEPKKRVDVMGQQSWKDQKCFISGGKYVKGHIRKVMSVNVSLIQPHIPREGRGSASGWRGIWSCFWFIDMVLLSLWDPNKVLAGWPALLGGRAEADGANGIRMPEPHLSAVMAGWQVLMDRWSWRLSWQSRLADELWNETDIQKLWAAQAWTEPPPSPSPGQLVWQRAPQCSYPSSPMTEVMWAAKLGTAETHRPALGLDPKSFNDRLWPSIMLTFPFNAVLVGYKLK